MLAWLACFAVLRYSYRGATVSTLSYVVTCSILACCGLVSWLLRWRGVRVIEFLSSAAIAFALAIGLILLSEAANIVDGMPWQDFYKDDYIIAFLPIAPLTIGVLSGLLTLLPEATPSRQSY